MGRVDGKVALITGAARGQGRSHALRLAEEGADIIAVDLCAQVASVPYDMATPKDLEETVSQVEALDRRIVATQADVRDSSALREAVDQGVAELGHLDIVSANAGIFSTASAAEMDDDVWQDMIDINLTGVWKTCKAAIPHLSNGSSIVITSSAAGLKAVEGAAHYVSAKHGLVGLMRTLALELAAQGVRVNSIHPTNVDTDMIQNDAMYRLFMPDQQNPTRDDFAEVAQGMQVLHIPWVEARDISNALLFLVSDEARYITGVTLPVDAGMLIK